MKYEVYAKCVKESDESCSFTKHNLEVGKIYKVDEIDMGSWSTSVIINNKSYNSVYLKFYVDGKEVDIYKSKAFNPYLTKGKEIWFINN